MAANGILANYLSNTIVSGGIGTVSKCTSKFGAIHISLIFSKATCSTAMDQNFSVICRVWQGWLLSQAKLGIIIDKTKE